MYDRYLVTGASGFLGRAVLTELLKRGASVRALVMRGDPRADGVPAGAEKVFGDVCDPDSLGDFFEGAGRNTCVIHCAGVVSVASHPGEMIRRVNVGGTENVLRQCKTHGIRRFVYVSSVHAIPEKPAGKEITEDAVFSPELVRGDYAKSKAEATALVFAEAGRGLDASVVFPSGIIGPGDTGGGSITFLLRSFIEGKLRTAVRGGYDFVDVRDVACGIVSCADRGRPGKGYILSGHYASISSILRSAGCALNVSRRVRCLPLFLAKLAAPFFERRSLRRGQPLYFTPYSVAVLGSNCLFSRSAAAEAFGYHPRSVRSSIRDAVLWLKETGTQRRD